MNETPRLELVIDNTEDEIPQLKPDGKGPPTTDWLSNMSSGTQFFCRDKTGQFAPRWLVFEYIHGGKLNGHVWLIPRKTMNDVATWSWCVPEDFSRAFEFRGLSPEYPEEPENGQHDGSSNQDPEPD